MKITFLGPQFSQGGGSRVIANYALGLRDLGHDVTVVSKLPARKSLLRKAADLLRGNDIREDPNYACFFDPLGDRHIQVEQLFPVKPAALPDADILIATWWRTAFEAVSMPPEKGTRVYFVQGHETFDEFRSDLAAGSYYLPLRKIVISKWLQDIMAETYGDKTCLKVGNAVDIQKFATPTRSKSPRPTVGLIYSSFGIKGAKTAIEAIERLRKQNPMIRIVAFGSGDESKALPLPSGSQYTKLPPQDEIPNLYSACDVWIVPSLSEGFGLPILEAMACRTPVVATRTGAAEDLIEDGMNGYVVDIEDTEALTDRVAKILALSPEDWRAMSDKAHDSATSRTWADAVKEFESALQSLKDQNQ